MKRRPLYFASFLAPSIQPFYQAVADYVGQRIGWPTELIVGTSFSQFASAGADVGFICGLPYVQLTRRPNPAVELLAAPVLQDERFDGKPLYLSDVIVRADSPYQTFADLRGRTWSYNDIRSHSGYNVTRYKLVSMGEINGFFGSVIEAGSHQHSIRLVCSGRVDASAIDCQILAMSLRDEPALGQKIRIIDSLGPATIQPVVAATSLPESLKKDIQTALLDMGEDPTVRSAMDQALVEKFVLVTDEDYNDIRAMRDSAEAVGIYTLN